MLTTQNETSILDRIKAARAPADSEVTTDEQPEAEEKTEVENEPTNEQVVDEVEESEQEVNKDVTTDDETEDLYVEIDGREINLKDVKEWEQGNLRQSDYTRKTKALADERKSFETEQQTLREKQAKLDDKLLLIESMIEEDSLTDEELAELREYDAEKYIEHTEKQNKRKEFLKSKSKPKAVENNVNAEFDKVVAKHSDWSENGKPTEKFNNDIKNMQEYLIAKGFTDNDLSLFTEKHFDVIFDALGNKAKADVNAKRVRKAPVSTKPKQQKQSNVVTEIKAAEQKLKRSGKIEDAIALRKLKRQLN